MNKKRFFRYKIEEVYEGCRAKVSVGDVLIDTWHGKSYSYQFEGRGIISPGFFVKLVGEVTEPETLAQLRDKR